MNIIYDLVGSLSTMFNAPKPFKYFSPIAVNTTPLLLREKVSFPDTFQTGYLMAYRGGRNIEIFSCQIQVIGISFINECPILRKDGTGKALFCAAGS